MNIKPTAIFDFFLKNFQKIIKFITQSYLFTLLNSFLFLSRFSVTLKSLDNYFFRWFTQKSLFSRFSVLISYNMWPFNHFSISSCFPGFSGSGSRVQGPGSASRTRVQGPGSGSRVWVQVLEVAVMVCVKKIYFLIILTFDVSIFSQKRKKI